MATTEFATVSRPTDQVHLATYDDYLQAQAAVDLLSDEKFPVERVSIVGHQVHIVEQVTGRMTNWKAAGMGAAGGAWFGLLFGLLFAIFAPLAPWFGIVLGAVVLSAFWGAIFGFVGHWATRGRRDFSSNRGLEADQWELVVDPGFEHRARAMLAGEAVVATAATPPAPSTAPVL